MARGLLKAEVCRMKVPSGHLAEISWPAGLGNRNWKKTNSLGTRYYSTKSALNLAVKKLLENIGLQEESENES